MGVWSDIAGAAGDLVDASTGVGAATNTLQEVVGLFGPDYEPSGGGEIQRQLASSGWNERETDCIVDWSKVNKPGWYAGTESVWGPNDNKVELYAFDAKYWAAYRAAQAANATDPYNDAHAAMLGLGKDASNPKSLGGKATAIWGSWMEKMKTAPVLFWSISIVGAGLVVYGLYRIVSWMFKPRYSKAPQR